MKRILFVCTGNLCRSPMAEYLLQSILEKHGVDDILIESSGTIATEGNHASYRSVKQLWNAEKIDMRPHRARRLTKAHIKEADMIIGMEQYHIDTILSMAPNAKDKTELIGEYMDNEDEMELPDPYGGPEEYFVEVYKLLVKALNNLASKLQAVEGKKS